MAIKVPILFLSLAFFSGTLFAGPWPAGHARLGYGVQQWPDSGTSFSDQAGLGQLSFDIKPWLVPVYWAVDLSGTVKENGQITLPSGTGVLESSTQEVSLGARYYQDVGPVELYGGLSLTYLKTEQQFRSSTFIRNAVSNGFGSTLVLGLTDLKILLPLVGWGIEYRVARTNLKTIVDVEPKKGSWLITTGISW